jgi:predicted secreted protein
MARFTGKMGKVTLASGEVTSITDWTLDAKVDDVTSTAMQDTWHQKLTTFLGWDGSFTGHWESAGANIAAWTQFLTGATATVELFPDKNQTEKFAGSAFIEFNLKAPHNGVVAFTAKFKGTGTLTRTP